MGNFESVERERSALPTGVWTSQQPERYSRNLVDVNQIETSSATEFAHVMRVAESAVPRRLELDPEKTRNGLGQLVLTLVKLIHELLEKQAIRRMESGSLSDGQIERLGQAMMQQAQEIDRLRAEFGLEEEDLNLDLGPLGKLL